jgi:hypothetical protein
MKIETLAIHAAADLSISSSQETIWFEVGMLWDANPLRSKE